MSRRIKRFAAFAIFALFYHFAAVDSILGLSGHHVDTKVDTKTVTATTIVSLPEETAFRCPQFPVAEQRSIHTSIPKCSRALAGDNGRSREGIEA